MFPIVSGGEGPLRENAVGVVLRKDRERFRDSAYPDQSGKRGRLRPTAAMMAKVTSRLWTVEDLYNEVSGRYLG